MLDSHSLPESFVQKLLTCQGSIFAYAVSLLGDPEGAEEVLQEVNVVLCRQAEQSETVTNFTAWACKIAYFEILSYRKRHQRDRHKFDDRLLDLLAEEAVPHTDRFEERRRALTECLHQLPRAQRSMILRRYGRDGSVQQMAKELSRSPGSISLTLFRLRRALLKCIDRRVALTD
ncbi:MAG: sigma-70 family RNA polymerase sigma factor [Pirellulales bacterium]|nr:sigma-70 family RNA polymerase sigma factor [Pirellulales bacterium]